MKTKAEVMRALRAYAAKYKISIDEAAYAMVVDDIIRKGGFGKVKNVAELIP